MPARHMPPAPHVRPQVVVCSPCLHRSPRQGHTISQQHTVTSRNGTDADFKQNQIVSRRCQVQAYSSTRRVKAVRPIYALYIASHHAHLHEMQATCCCQSQLTLLCPCCAGPAPRCYDCSKLRKQSSGKGLLGCNRLLWQRSPAGRSHTEHSGVLSVVHVFECVRDWAQQLTPLLLLFRPEVASVISRCAPQATAATSPTTYTPQSAGHLADPSKE